MRPARLAAHKRISLRKFFNDVGRALFEGEWTSSELSALSRLQTKSAPGEDASRALEVEAVIYPILASGRITIEIDFTRLPPGYEDLVTTDKGRTHIYRIRPEAWELGTAEIDWAAGTVSVALSELDPPDVALAASMGEDPFDLVGYVADPATIFQGIFRNLEAIVRYRDLVAPSVAPRRHLWAEITAYLWRHIALVGPLTGARKEGTKLIEKICAYLCKNGYDEENLPPQSQLWEAIKFVRAQAAERSTDAPVTPNFADLRRAAKHHKMKKGEKFNPNELPARAGRNQKTGRRLAVGNRNRQ